MRDFGLWDRLDWALDGVVGGVIGSPELAWEWKLPESSVNTGELESK